MPFDAQKAEGFPESQMSYVHFMVESTSGCLRGVNGMISYVYTSGQAVYIGLAQLFVWRE